MKIPMLAVLFALAAVGLGGCNTVSDYTVILRNQDTQPAHLIALYETGYGPYNKVEPGQSRSLTGTCVPDQDLSDYDDGPERVRLEVKAGRNGVTLSTRTAEFDCKYTNDLQIFTFTGSTWVYTIAGP